MTGNAAASKPPPVLADLGTRGGALLLDLVLVVAALGTIQELGGFNARPVVLVLAVLYFCGMPLTRLQGTFGKWICRIRICDKEGRRIGGRAAVVRGLATLGWLALPGLLGEAAMRGMTIGAALPAVLVVFLLPWALAGFLARRQSLFDLLAGTMVVRRSADAAAVQSIDLSIKPRWIRATGLTVFCLLSGVMMSAGIAAFQDQERRGRVLFAIEATRPLRERIEAFHEKEKRWPTAAEAGVAEWTPYPAGGGYRLGPDGSVTISFSQAPELKGHSIRFRPAPIEGGARLRWDCTADAGLPRSYLPGACRD